MNAAVLTDGKVYYIPPKDTDFFKELADRMKWEPIDATKRKEVQSSAKSWVDLFAGKWQDSRSTEQIVKDIHDARTSNQEVSL
jgi:hypothetical protein